MIYNNPLFKRSLIRIVLIVITSWLFAAVIIDRFSVLLGILLLLALVLQIHLLFKEINRDSIAIRQFLDHLKDKKNNPLHTKEILKSPHLKTCMTEIQQAIDKGLKEKEDEYQYFRNIVQHVGIGIITFNSSGDIQLFNFAAKKLLNKHKAIKNIIEIKPLSDELYDSFKELKTGGRKLIEVKVGEEVRQLSVYAIELKLHDSDFKLISLQNIQTELDEKEMQAWRNLIRVLTHEIMNSVTPISSLTGSAKSVLDELLEEDKTVYGLSQDDVKDLQYSLRTIGNRSESLIHFLNEFRSLTHTPQPKLEEVPVNEMLISIEKLMRKEASEKDIKLNLQLDDRIADLAIDRALIEQVIINLVKNAMEAFDEENVEKNIELNSNLDKRKRVTITVKDNGVGIEPEALSKIFIPFYTTKKTGSGIGLSLSKEIMRKHNGNISVQSSLGSGTEFTLKFY